MAPLSENWFFTLFKPFLQCLPLRICQFDKSFFTPHEAKIQVFKLNLSKNLAFAKGSIFPEGWTFATAEIDQIRGTGLQIVGYLQEGIFQKSRFT
jgi:hypothetical protein